MRKAIFSGGRGEFTQAWSQNKTALHVASHEPVILECYGQAVGGWTCQVSGGHKLGKCLRT